LLSSKHATGVIGGECGYFTELQPKLLCEFQCAVYGILIE